MATKYREMVLGIHEAIKEAVDDTAKQNPLPSNFREVLEGLVAQSLGAVIINGNGEVTFANFTKPVQDADEHDAPSDGTQPNENPD